MTDPPGPTPRFLTEPVAVIAAVVTAIDADLERHTVAEIVADVAGTRAQQRRLAQTLHEDPGLLTSGRPEGPRHVEQLVVALQNLGATGFFRPRCADCSRGRLLTEIDAAGRRVCGSCAFRARGGSGDCANCGNHRRIDGRDPHGRPLCRPCRGGTKHTDLGDVVHRHLLALDTGLDEHTLRKIADTVLARPSQQAAMSRELSAFPARPLEDPARRGCRSCRAPRGTRRSSPSPPGSPPEC